MQTRAWILMTVALGLATAASAQATERTYVNCTRSGVSGTLALSSVSGCGAHTPVVCSQTVTCDVQGASGQKATLLIACPAPQSVCPDASACMSHKLNMESEPVIKTLDLTRELIDDPGANKGL